MSGSHQAIGLSFDSIAEKYHRVRPTYPEELFEDLFVETTLGQSSRILEVGCGTGQASVALAKRVRNLICVEPGENMAAIAKRSLDSLPGVEVHQATFEEFEPVSQSFDAVFAATCWHWIDPQVGYLRAHQALKPDGYLCIVSCGHAFPKGYDLTFDKIQSCYESIEPTDSKQFRWPPAGPDQVSDSQVEIITSGLFNIVFVKRYVWAVSYSAHEYVELLGTYSDHLAMAPGKREGLFEKIRGVIESSAHGTVEKHYQAILHVASPNM